MRQEKVLLVMSLIARRSSAWMHDVVCSTPISHGEVSDDAVQRFTNDIKEALAILTDPERGQWVVGEPAPPAVDREGGPLEGAVENHGIQSTGTTHLCPGGLHCDMRYGCAYNPPCPYSTRQRVR